MKLKLLIPILLIIFMISFSVGAFFWYTDSLKAVSSDKSSFRFVVTKGSSASQVGNKLHQAGLIKSPLAFKIYLQLTNNTKAVKPGEFSLQKNMDINAIVAKLLKGPDEIWVTIPEGLRREEVVEKVIDQLEISDPNFRIDFLALTKDSEGTLFPDTYLFPKDVTPEQVIKVLNDTYEKKFAEITKKTSRSKDEITIMASIIERETKTNDERPIVAGILWKRLDTDGWLIQADATVQYAHGSLKCKSLTKCDWWPVLTKEDLEINSYYNTYKNKTLPPTPIANPGLPSLSAAANPEESDYWFYIHDKEGKIHYATDINSHNLNIAKYLR